MEFNWAFLMLHDIIVENVILFSREISSIYDKKKKGGGSQILDWTYARGGGHSDAYCVQQWGRGGLKIRKNCVCN